MKTGTALLHLLQRPLVLTEEYLQFAIAIASRGEFFAEELAAQRAKVLDARGGEPLKNTHGCYVRDGVAVIPVYGPLFRHANIFTELSGATSYETLMKDTQAAQDKGLPALLDCDSPGGEVDGCSEYSDFIYAARARGLLVHAYAGGMAASGGLWIFTAAERRTVAETAIVGSVGVKLAMLDTSEQDKARGVRKVEVISSNAPGKRSTPIDDEVIASMQTLCDDLEQVFVKSLARNCGVTAEHVLENFGKGGVMVGAAGVSCGIAHGLSSFEAALAELSAAARAPKNRITSLPPAAAHNTEKTMTKPAQTSATPAPKAADDKDPKSADDKGGECADDEKDPKSKDDEKDPDAEEEKDDTKAEDDEPMGEDEKEEKEKAAHAALAKLAGLKAGAPLWRIATAIEVKMVPAADAEREKGALEAKYAELKARLDARDLADRKAAAARFAKAAFDDGRCTEKKIARVEQEYVSSGEKAAEELLEPKGTFTVLRRFSDGKGGVIGKKDDPQSFAADDPAAIEAAYATKAKEIAKRDKVSFSEACKKVRAEAPELYAQYAALGKK